ncbi:MAG TPA: biotin/lipoate A/B protein ligase family protein [bacterium]|nr:biotin/lipoate A/B protein ligase family protein [bacterium]
METLRVIFSPPGDARWNMAVDEALLAGVIGGGTGPTLRLYSWRPPGISLGHFQPAGMADLGACARRGVEVVRRVTGGGAVFHHGDVTACLVCPASILPRNVRESYRLLSGAHAAAIRSLGLNAGAGGEAPPLPRRLRPGYDCFARLTECDVAVGGVKVAGSAQRRKGGAVLHHTSVVWEPQPSELLIELLPGAASLGRPAAVLELAPGADRRGFEELLAGEVARALGLEPRIGELTGDEISSARRLAGEKRLEIVQPG